MELFHQLNRQSALSGGTNGGTKMNPDHLSSASLPQQGGLKEKVLSVTRSPPGVIPTAAVGGIRSRRKNNFPLEAQGFAGVEPDLEEHIVEEAADFDGNGVPTTLKKGSGYKTDAELKKEGIHRVWIYVFCALFGGGVGAYCADDGDTRKAHRGRSKFAKPRTPEDSGSEGS